MNRRQLLRVLAAGAAAAGLPARAQRLPPIEVFKTPTCGCCSSWVDHLSAAGFTVEVNDVADTAPVRKRLGLPDRFGGCHTGVVGGYVVEGHVPAEDIKRMLAMKPAGIGLAVPGMPLGSPGMEVGDRKEPFDVILVDRAGRGSVFARYPKKRAA